MSHWTNSHQINAQHTLNAYVAAVSHVTPTGQWIAKEIVSPDIVYTANDLPILDAACPVGLYSFPMN